MTTTGRNSYHRSARHARQGLQKRGAAPWIRKLLPGARPQPDSTRFPCTVVARFRSRIDDDKPASPLHATCAAPTHRFARRGVNSSLCPRAQLCPVLSPLCEACPVHRVPTLIILSCVPPLVRASRGTSFVPQEPLCTMSTITVSAGSDLNEAVASATSGSTILLEDGTWTCKWIDNTGGGVAGGACKLALLETTRCSLSIRRT